MEGFKIHNFDFAKLIAFAEKANDEVYLRTNEGDMLNLKSRLTQLMALSNAIDWGTVGEATVICKDPEDETKLFRMNLYGSDET